VDSAGGEIVHIHSIVVKPGEGSAHFDVDGVLENLSSTSQQELANILRPRYSPWTATKVESENRRLNKFSKRLLVIL
jgi:hypothetical protein